MHPIPNTIIAIEYLCVVLAIANLSCRAAKRRLYWLVAGTSLSSILVFVSCGAHHFAHAWLSSRWELVFTGLCAIGSLPMALIAIFGRGLAWAKLTLLLAAQQNYKSLQASYDASASGLVELQWNSEAEDFIFTRCNRIGATIIQGIGGPVTITGCALCEAVSGHEKPLEDEDGLSTLEIYRRVAFGIAPYESGRRDALLSFPSPSQGIRYFQQTVLRIQQGLISIGFTDVSDRIETENKLRQQAISDQLIANCYSRLYATEQLDRAAHAWESRGVDSVAIHLDLDGFKPINDAYGHPAGDYALQTVADRIRSELRHQDTLARMGGDEFLIILSGADQEIGYSVAQRIRAHIAQPMKYTDINGDTYIFAATASIGVSSFGQEIAQTS